MPDALWTLLASVPVPPADDPLPPEGEARVMLAVLAAIILALIGLISITIVRIAHRRASERDELAARENAPPQSAWSVAGQRAEPIDDDPREHDRG